MPPRQTKRQFGTVSQLPSGRWRARYTGPDGKKHSAATTFPESDDAYAWLSNERKIIDRGEWIPPKQRARAKEDDARTVGELLTEWLELRTLGNNPLGPATHQNYTATINRRILEVSGKAARLRDIPLIQLTRRDVAAWWDAINLQYDTPPTNRAAYKDSVKTAAANRHVPIFPHYNDDFEYHLNHFTNPDPNAFLFTGPTGKIVMDTSYRSIMTRAKERAGHKDVRITPHYGRVWLITTLVEVGIPIPAIGEILGQRDLRTITEIYMRTTEAKKCEVLDSVNRALEGLPAGVADLDAKRAEQTQVNPKCM